MNAQDLKNSILQLAIQGKLVEQRKEEGTAKELIEEIKAEKERLIKEKKIKKEKPLAEITEDEVPFEIPESWEWVRVGDVSSIFGRIGYRGYTKDDMVNKGEGAITISPSNITSGGKTNFDNCSYISWDKYDESPEIMIYDGDIILVKTGSSYGKCSIVKGLPEKATLNPQLVVLKNILCDIKFLDFALKSNLAKNQFERFVIGTSIPTFSQAKLSSLVIPLPPLAEQKRIVAKIEVLMPYIEKYGDAHSKLEVFNKKFPDDMQKSILQYAIQGKLVEQRKEEGTAEELYKQIQEEKEKLIKEKKIKKEKPLSEITENEVPFEIPESWKWVRLLDVCEYIQRGKSPKYSDIQKYPVVAQKCNQWSGFSIEKAKFIDPDTINKYTPERFLRDGDLMWNSTGLGTLGRMAIYYAALNPYELAVADSHVTVIRALKEFISYRYLYYYFANPSVQNVIEKQSDGSTKQKELATSTIKSYVVPLPPLEEQKRIVAKIEEMLPYCKQLVK